MIKNILKLSVFLLMPLFVGCELNQYPDSEIPMGGAFENMTDFSRWSNRLYANFRGTCVTGADEQDILVDYYQPTLNETNFYTPYYDWSFDASSMGGVWSAAYASIKYSNLILAQGDKYLNKLKLTATPRDFEADSTQMAVHFGDAYLTRAFQMARLAQAYCANYDESKQQLGVPIVTEVDIDARPSRSSLKDTYAFILSDIEKAEKLITNNDFSQGLFTQDMVKALKSRVLLSMHKNEEALEEAKALINCGRFSLAADAKEFAAQWVNDKGGEFIYVPFLSLPNDRAGYNWADGPLYSYVGGAVKPKYVPTSSTLKLYPSGDIRRDVYFKNYTVVAADNVGLDIALLNKYPGNPALLDKGRREQPELNRWNAPKPFRLAEQYMIAAEAAAALDDDPQAQKFLNELRQKRGVYATTAVGKRLEKEIRNEWKREFIGEGLYYFYLKRNNLGFTRSAASQDASIIIQTNQCLNLTVEPTNKKWAWEIPSNDKTTNPNIDLNWK